MLSHGHVVATWLNLSGNIWTKEKLELFKSKPFSWVSPFKHCSLCKKFASNITSVCVNDWFHFSWFDKWEKQGKVLSSPDCGLISVNDRPINWSPALSYFNYRSFTHPTVHPAVKQTETIGGPGWTPQQHYTASPFCTLWVPKSSGDAPNVWYLW